MLLTTDTTAQLGDTEPWDPMAQPTEAPPEAWAWTDAGELPSTQPRRETAAPTDCLCSRRGLEASPWDWALALFLPSPLVLSWRDNATAQGATSGIQSHLLSQARRKIALLSLADSGEFTTGVRRELQGGFHDSGLSFWQILTSRDKYKWGYNQALLLNSWNVRQIATKARTAHTGP